MIKQKMAPNPNQRDQSGASGKTKRQKMKQPASGGHRKQQAPITSETGQNRNLSLSLSQSDDSAWIYGMISNMQILLQNDQRLKQAVRRQQQLGGNSNGLGTQAARHGAKSSARSRPSNSSSGYSTPSSLYSAASLSPPFSSPTALVNCVYASSSSSNSPNSVMTTQSQSSCSSSSSSSPSSKYLKAAASEVTKQKSSSTGTNATKSNNQLQKQQQILPRSPISRQIKFHEYKGPPQARRPSNQQKQQQQQPKVSASDTSTTSVTAFNVEQLNGAHHQIQRMQTSNQLQAQPTQPTASLASMTNQQIQCGHPTLANQPTATATETVERRVVKAINVAPSGYALASNQPRQVSLQLIRSADGQQQQVLVLDPVAFEQMQPPQPDYNQQRGGSIIVLQHAEPTGPVGIYNTLLMNSNNSSSDNDNRFQAQQPAGLTTGRSLSVSESHQGQAPANFRGQLQRVEQQQQPQAQAHEQQVFPNEELYYRPQQPPTQALQQRVTNLRSQTHELQFDAGCRMGPNPQQQQQQQQQQQAPQGANYQLANQQLLEQVPATINQQHDQNQMAHFYQSQEVVYAPVNGFSNSLGPDETLEDDTCEIEPTISFDGDLEHGMMMYSEFIDSQDIPLNVDESDWLRKFLPPCSSS